ncbi:hypothetical protein CAPTEDRAFT_228173 [Capitella teleta]|uniref:Uncharacterized protein n=1 Tax=Capitella teleta TaxID=283909 RepID=R7U7T1_CAPTE|nr:hypothetical protein CAPTEDRAFT_228173 [Capitella teleta]|eukprot:ELU02019.1 hypothetical protein CAPTEDRAFT_228173 [Capitella teleta]
MPSKEATDHSIIPKPKPSGSPVFSADCPSAEVVPLYTAVTIRCKVTSPSELTNSYFYWHHYVVIHLKDYEVTEEHEFKVIENNSSKITLLPVDKNEVIHSGSENTTSWAREGRYTGMVFPQANNSAILELKIEHMTNQMYRRHFFAVDNEFGTAEYVIELKRESDPGSSAPHVTSSPFAALLAILVVLVFFH